jgi:hypothetical protein
MIRSHLSLLFLAALAVAGCDDGTAPAGQTRPDTDLNVLRHSAASPPLAATSVSFWAVRGDNREASLYYRPAPGETDSAEFLNFEVPNSALLARPDGQSVAEGDSVLITIRVLDPSRFIVEFEPSGLQFSPRSPARLKVRFAEADDDIDGDGDDDSDDEELKSNLAIWRQEAAGQPWTRLSSELRVDAEEIEARLVGFSNYAIAY